jgi:hypothetical protein
MEKDLEGGGRSPTHVLSAMFMPELKKTTKCITQGSRFPGRNTNRALHEQVYSFIAVSPLGDD